MQAAPGTRIPPGGGDWDRARPVPTSLTRTEYRSIRSTTLPMLKPWRSGMTRELSADPVATRVTRTPGPLVSSRDAVAVAASCPTGFV